MSLLDIILIAIVIALIVCPSKYDPAIRLKEWTEKKRRGK
jgi:Sec-independent protein translocase protein TatA